MDRLRKHFRKWLWSICWEIGDQFLWYAMKLQGPPDETWTKVDLHEKCQPKPAGRFRITASTVPVTWTATATNSTAMSWFADWDSPEDSAYEK